MPLVNLLLFLALVLLPTRDKPPHTLKAPGESPPPVLDPPVLEATSPVESIQPVRDAFADPRVLVTGVSARSARRGRPAFEPLRQVHRSIVLESQWRSGLVALAIAVPLAVLAVLVGGAVLQSYGFSPSLGPFTLGMVTVLLYGFSRPKPLGSCIGVAMLAVALAGMAILCAALEGAICLIMAAADRVLPCLSRGGRRLYDPSSALAERQLRRTLVGSASRAAGIDGGRIGATSRRRRCAASAPK